jgi:ABC-type transport system substrate-binding protein
LTPQGFLGKGFIGYVTNFEDWPEEIKQYYVYDPEGAEKLLDEAGYPRGADGIRFKATLHYSLAWNRLEHDQIAVEYWKKIGVEIKLEGVDGSGFGAKLQDGSGQFLVNISGYEWNPVGQIAQQATVVDSPWNVAQVKDPVYDAMHAAMASAQTLEEQMRASKPIDMYMNNQHWYLWGGRVPQFHAAQPWIIGYNGETELGDMDRILIMARLWIDSARKKEMGY